MDTQCNLCKKLDIVSECTGILGYIYKAVEYGHQSYGVLYCYLLKKKKNIYIYIYIKHVLTKKQ